MPSFARRSALPEFFDFPFRASRTYVHSASLCNMIAAHLGPCEQFEVVLKHWMDSRLYFTPVPEVRAGSGSGYVRVRQDGVERTWEISEDKRFPVTSREPYDEDDLVAHARIEDRQLHCPEGSDGTFFDRLIAANKKLINIALDPGVKLIAARVMCRGGPANSTAFSLRIQSSIGTRIFKSRIEIDGEAFGEVIFYGN